MQYIRIKEGTIEEGYIEEGANEESHIVEGTFFSEGAVEEGEGGYNTQHGNEEAKYSYGDVLYSYSGTV